ncbi:MAG: DNA primase [Bacteriovorax sp.]|nr:DNA primase [Rhizobacter sp.]
MIPPAFIQDLLSRVDIAEVVGRHVQLRKGGANLSGLCPFHAEKSPSFTVSPTKQFYHCFGCGASGDAIRFLTEYSGMTFLDAVKDLAQQVGMTVPEEDSSPAEREQAAAQKQRRNTLTDVLAKATDHYRKQLKNSPRAVDYLKGRGLSGEIAAQFGLGYAPEGWRGLASVFPHYDDPLLAESGMVIVQGDEGADEADKKRYDRFRDRIMFPIRSVQGDVIGFGGRVLDHGEPKYLNSPETPVFSKGRELYGLFEARTALRQRGYALVVEGYMDVVALAQSGFGNAVATLGTACTAEHMQKLFRFTDSVVFSFDGDKAGRRAAGRALEACLPHATDTRTVRFLYLPPEHDPDSYVRELGAAAFEACVAQAVPLSRQVAETAREGKDLDTAEGRAHMLADARPLWSTLPDGALKRQLAGELATVGRMEAGELMSMWGATSAPRASRDAAAPRPPPRRATRLGKGTASLLDRAIWLLLHRCEMWSALDGESHDLLAEQAAPYDMLFGCIERSIHEHGTLAPAALLDEMRLQAAGVDEAAAVIARIAAFHASDPHVDFTRELNLVLDGLRLKAVRDELDLMVETGLVSPDSHQRFKRLNGELARLKNHLAKQQSAMG